MVTLLQIPAEVDVAAVAAEHAVKFLETDFVDALVVVVVVAASAVVAFDYLCTLHQLNPGYFLDQLEGNLGKKMNHYLKKNLTVITYKFL